MKSFFKAGVLLILVCICLTHVSFAGDSCPPGQYRSNGVCLLEVPGNTYFVSVDGDDNNPGTFDAPFYSWQKAVEVSRPGDITYFRGGIWHPTRFLHSHSSTIGMGIAPTLSRPYGASGTKEKPIRYFNYPGERPILDGSLMKPNKYNQLSGISLHGVEHVYFKGLTIRHIHQNTPDISHRIPYSQVCGIGSTSCANLYFEDMVVHDIDGRAYQHKSGAWNEWDGPNAPFESDTTTWINCDAYNLFDRHSRTPGYLADGWNVKTYSGGRFSWKGCRVWNFSDDGIESHGAGYRAFENCWVMSSNKYKGLYRGIDGNGFVIGAPNADQPDTDTLADPVLVSFRNCIAADNIGVGFGNNLHCRYNTNNTHVYNSFAYANNIGFHEIGANLGHESRGCVYRNNIAYGSKAVQDIFDPLYEVAIYRPSVYEESHNSWVATQKVDGWPGWEYNPAVSVTDDDFVSLDTSQLTLPRKPDNSLPDITFGKLKEDSDLIDAGIDVGLPYSGNAPDIGVFESADTQMPGIPSNISATVLSDTQIRLSWETPPDNTSPAGYRIFRGQDEIAIVTETFFTDSGLTPLTRYEYSVAAFDSYGNESEPSSMVAATTLAGLSCPPGQYRSNGVCLLEVPGDTYFVSLQGDDNNPGTFDAPFYSWQKAVEVSQPGDITYIRGGVWQPTRFIYSNSSTIGMGIAPTLSRPYGASGTKEKPIRYFNYPGERPVLDGSLMKPSQYAWLSGISLHEVEHIYFKGLTVRHIHQDEPDPNRTKSHSEVYGIGSTSCANLYFENMVVHDIDGRAYQHWSGAWNDWDRPNAPFESDTTTWMNCDAYNLFDRHSTAPGNGADGWKVGTHSGGRFYWKGCRAWNYSDDGFDPHGAGYRVFENCWAMATNKYKDLFPEWDIEGNGFKVAAPGAEQPDTNTLADPVLVTFRNCIAADNPGSGFANNLHCRYNTNNTHVYNSFAYANDIGFHEIGANLGHESRGCVYRNNIAYGSKAVQDHFDPLYEVAIYRPSVYEESHNSWVATQEVDGWPGWEYNPAVSVTDDDFISLDTSQLTLPRKPDNSLPDITFGKLKKASDLVDAGTDVGLPYNGNAPDMAVFESGD